MEHTPENEVLIGHFNSPNEISYKDTVGGESSNSSDDNKKMDVNKLSSSSDRNIKIIHIDEKIGSDEINIPLRKEFTENFNNNIVDFENANNINCPIVQTDSNNLNTVRFIIDSKDSFDKNIELIKEDVNSTTNLNSFSKTLKLDTMCCIEEFNEVFKKYENNHINRNNKLNYSTLVPSLSETEDLLKSITESNQNESLHSTYITIPILATTKTKTIIGSNKIFKNPIEHVDHNYVMAISRDNSTQLSPNIDKDENSNVKDIHITDEALNSEFNLKDEVFLERNEYIINHYYSYDINHIEDSSINDKKSIISISSDSIECDTEITTSELNIIDFDVNNDIISISSTDDDKITDNDSDYCEGYNSSDFEFIDEKEANLGGIIKASKSKVNLKNDLQLKKLNKAGHSFEPNIIANVYSSKYVSSKELNDNLREIPYLQTIESKNISKSTNKSSTRTDVPIRHSSKYVPSKVYNDDVQNEIPNLHKTFNKAVRNENFNKSIHFEDLVSDFGKDHIIPEDEDFLELFAQPWTVYQYEAENKAFYSNKTMDAEIDIGFNVGALQRRHEEIKVDDIYENEAKDNARKILSMYPFENTKRRRRF